MGVTEEKEKIVVTDGVLEICDYMGLDPYVLISEGTLLIACRPHKADTVVEALAKKKIKTSVAGELTESKKGMVLIEKGNKKRLVHPIVDPFWRYFCGALEKNSTK